MGAADQNPDHLPAPFHRFVAPRLGRAERRALLGGDVQAAADLAVCRIGERVYVGIRGGGRCRLTRAEARQLAATLIDLGDDEDPEKPA